jgi:hypothetical protein
MVAQVDFAAYLLLDLAIGRNRAPLLVENCSCPRVGALYFSSQRSPRGDLTFLVTSFGKSFTAAGFGNWFREQCDEATLPHCSAHGLRKAGATIAAERGATDRQLMALYDWETAAQANVYTAAADRRQLAGEAARLLAGDQNENKQCPTELSHLGNLMIFQNDNEVDGGSDGTRTRDLRRDRPTL